jgi:hypothetical protein
MSTEQEMTNGEGCCPLSDESHGDKVRTEIGFIIEEINQIAQDLALHSPQRNERKLLEILLRLAGYVQTNCPAPVPKEPCTCKPMWEDRGGDCPQHGRVQ